MQEILADISHLLMLYSKPDALLAAVIGTFLPAGKFSLLADEFLLMLAIGFGVCNAVAVAVGIELFDADIQADNASIIAMSDLILLHAKRNIEFPACRHGNRRIENAAVKVFETFVFHKTDFRNLNSVSDNAKAIALIPRPVRLLPMLGMEPWKPRVPLKEVLICPVKVTKTFLKSHAVAFIQPEVVSVPLQDGEHICGFVVRQRNSIFFIRPNTLCKKVVVDKSARAKHLQQSILLFSGRIYPGLKSFLHRTTPSAMSSGSRCIASR